LFENLELIRTVEAAGGVVRVRRDLFVDRRPPTTSRFVEQRVRQAYDDFARPSRLLVALATVPAAVLAVGRRRWGSLGLGAIATIGLAEVGRRRDGGSARFSPTTPLFAPLWMLERGVCAWLALASRIVLGGCRYRGTVIRRAATPPRELRQRARRRGIRRRSASFASGRNGTAEPRHDARRAPIRPRRSPGSVRGRGTGPIGRP
jgi:hypothetical protein